LDQLSQHIESLIFTAQGPISLDEIKEALEDRFETKFKKAEVESAIEEVLEKYKSDAFSFEIVPIANGYQFFTKGAFHGTVGSRLKLTSKKQLSKAALETLAVIAYKQPITKGECEMIRGVSCDYTIQKLLEKELISISGRDESVGRPLLYTTSQKFMDYFGLRDLSELPKPKDFQLPDEEIGNAAPIEELSEEQREKKTIELEVMSDEVAAAIGGNDIFPSDFDTVTDEAETDHSETVDNRAEVLPSEETEPEAAIDDEPNDNAAEQPMDETQQYYYGSADSNVEIISENMIVMPKEEMEALLAADALIEEEGEEDFEEDDLSEEEEEAIVHDIEEELKAILEAEQKNKQPAEKDAAKPSAIKKEVVKPDFTYEVDSIAAMVANLPKGVAKASTGLPDEKRISSEPVLNKIKAEQNLPNQPAEASEDTQTDSKKKTLAGKRTEEEDFIAVIADLEEDPEEDQTTAEAASDNAFTNIHIIPTHTEMLMAEPALAVRPAYGQKIKEITFRAEAEGNLSKAPAKEETRVENSSIFIEATVSQLTSDPLPFVSTEVNSESFIRPQHNPLMDAYLKKAAQKQDKPVTPNDKSKKNSLFRSVREKITLYLRKLTLKDIRFIDEDE
jgi:segregation and condensation protein B